jgi:cytochrome b involved in lipid metabolism
VSTKAKSVIFIVVLALIGLGAFLLISNSDDDSNKTSNNVSNSNDVSQSEDPVVSEEPITITLGEVSSRNSEQECWTIVSGSVYDITSYIPRHPGGDEILLACGTDGTSLFNERKTDSGEIIGSGTPHSSGAANQLDSFFIGVLAN